MRSESVHLILQKTIFSILLLVSVTFCVPGKHEQNKAAQNYEAEENCNVTVEWSFSHKGDISVPSIKIHCVLTPELKVFFHLDDSMKEHQHEQFVGRVLCDTDALGAGLVRLHLSRVRTEDSGLYLCRMATEFGKKVNVFSLNITAAADESKPLLRLPPGRNRIFLCVSLVLLVAAVMVLVSLCCGSTYSVLTST